VIAVNVTVAHVEEDVAVVDHLAAVDADEAEALLRRTGRQVYYRLVNADAAAIIRAIHRNHTRAAHFRDGEAI
jgi:hypothetical protein